MSDTEDIEEAEVKSIVAPNRIPTIDDSVPTADYIAYDKAKTRIVTYCIGEAGMYPGRFAKTYNDAYTEVKSEFGQVFEVNQVPNRAFFRVRKSNV